MLKNLLFVFVLVALFSSCAEKPEPVNPNATEEARDLLHFLYLLEGKRVLSGQHNYGHELTRSTDSVIAMTGETPVIWGSDFLGWDQGSHNTRQEVVDEAIRQWEAGSIITLMYHQVKPFDHDSLGFSRSVKGRVTDEEWERIVTPGSEYYDMLIDKLDNIAGYLKQLQDAGVPVLWRPYHEMNGMWFWYGARPGQEGFVKLWKIMYERYVNHHELDNLIWVWNPNAPRKWKDDEAMAYDKFFPGLEYVDVLAADIYKNDYKQSHHDQLLELAQGKPIAIGECGVMPTPDILKEQPSWVWFMTWARFVWRANEPEKVRELYNFEKVITQK